MLTTHDLYRCQDRRDQVDLAVVDFSKAFDVVPHDRLLGKLEFYGITGPVLNWISTFFKGLTQSVLVEVEHSKKDPGPPWCAPGYCVRPSFVSPIFY